jgi:hypothetical protein
MAILRAIADGERDARKLAKLRDHRCQKNEEEIADYDREILRRLAAMQREDLGDPSPPAVKNPQKAKSMRQFVSHVTLAPRRPTSGGKPVKKKWPNTASTRVAEALRMAALSLRRSGTALGAYYRRIARRIGADVAVFATARKLAGLMYRLPRWGQQYVDEGADAFEQRYQQTRITALTAKARELGYELLPKVPHSS